MAARLRIADSIAGALDRSLLGECSIGSGTRERGSCCERNERSNLGPRSKGLEVPRPCAWQSPNQIRRNPGGCDGASRHAIPSNPSKIARGERTSSGSRPSHAGRCGRSAGTQPVATSELETKRLSLRNHRGPGGWSGLG